MTQGDLFNLGPSPRIQNSNSPHVGRCELCGESGDVKHCKYCQQEFCEDCGTMKKSLCERCVSFFGSRGRV